jgi:hypothetical protein
MERGAASDPTVRLKPTSLAGEGSDRAALRRDVRRGRLKFYWTDAALVRCFAVRLGVVALSPSAAREATSGRPMFLHRASRVRLPVGTPASARPGCEAFAPTRISNMVGYLATPF